jgi:hypothetical protein
MANKNIFCVLLVIALLIPFYGYTADTIPLKTQKVITNPNAEVSTVRPTNKQWKNICEYFNNFQPVKFREALDRMNIEQFLGAICVMSKNEDCDNDNIFFNEFYNMGMRKDDRLFNELISANIRIFASLVDVDNDGVNELRLWFYSGTANCMLNYFWKKDATGYYKFIDIEGYDVLREEASGCYARLIFVPYKNIIYTLYINEFNNDTYPGETPRIWDIWRGSISELTLICTDRQWMIREMDHDQ